MPKDWIAYQEKLNADAAEAARRQASERAMLLSEHDIAAERRRNGAIILVAIAAFTALGGFIGYLIGLASRGGL